MISAGTAQIFCWHCRTLRDHLKNSQHSLQRVGICKRSLTHLQTKKESLSSEQSVNLTVCFRQFHRSVANGERFPTAKSTNFSSASRTYESVSKVITRPVRPVGNATAKVVGETTDPFHGAQVQKTKRNDGIHVLHSGVAERIVKLLGDDITKNDVTVFEINPGPGILTRALLRSGVHKLRLFETNSEFLSRLAELQEVHGDRLELMEADVFTLSKLVFRDKIALHNNVDNIFSGIQAKSWDDARPPIIMFGILPSSKESVFMRFLPVALSSLQALYSYGRVQLVLFISHKEYQCMTATPSDGFLKYRSFSILCQLFFNVELLCKEPLHNFSPCPKKPSLKKTHYDSENLYMVRITPKKDLFSLVATPEQLQELYFFVKQNTYKRKGFVISKLETWIPNCGVRLIKNGFTIFTRFGDLTPEEILKLFQEFSSWDEYPQCSFRLAMMKVKHEIDEIASSDDEVDDELDDDDHEV